MLNVWFENILFWVKLLVGIRKNAQKQQLQKLGKQPWWIQLSAQRMIWKSFILNQTHIMKKKIADKKKLIQKPDKNSEVKSQIK